MRVLLLAGVVALPGCMTASDYVRQEQAGHHPQTVAEEDSARAQAAEARRKREAERWAAMSCRQRCAHRSGECRDDAQADADRARFTAGMRSAADHAVRRSEYAIERNLEAEHAEAEAVRGGDLSECSLGLQECLLMCEGRP